MRTDARKEPDHALVSKERRFDYAELSSLLNLPEEHVHETLTSEESEKWLTLARLMLDRKGTPITVLTCWLLSYES